VKKIMPTASRISAMLAGPVVGLKKNRKSEFMKLAHLDIEAQSDAKGLSRTTGARRTMMSGEEFECSANNPKTQA
jgi:hypothetical protein